MRFQHMPQLTAAASARLQAGGPAVLWNQIVNDIRENNAQVFQCGADSFIVLRIDELERDLVILACTGSNGKEIMRHVIKLARNLNLDVRFHTSRNGMARLLRQFSPVEIERVYRIYTNEN